MKRKDELIEMIYEAVEENLLNKNLQKSLIFLWERLSGTCLKLKKN